MSKGVPEYCDCCGQKIQKPRKVRLGKQGVEALMGLAEEKGWVYVGDGNRGKDLKTNSNVRLQYCSRQYIGWAVWYGLAEKDKLQQGVYRITNTGIKFLKGEVSIPEYLLIRFGKVVGTSPDMQYVSDVRNLVLDREYWAAYPYTAY